MADATVSVVLELLVSIAKEQIEKEIQLVRGVDKDLTDLEKELNTIRRVLDDADRQQFKVKAVKDWLWRLEQTSYEMEDVLEEWKYAIHKHKMESESPPNQMVCSLISSSCFCFKKLGLRHDIAKKVKNIKSRLDEILREKDRYNFVISQPKIDHPPASRRVQSTSLIDLAQVQGRRNHDRDILVRKLSGSHLSYHVVSIVGAGGLGTTTLAQQVYNHSGVKQRFDHRIWICVSDPFDVAAIAVGIIKGIDKDSSPDATQLDALLNHLIGCISEKHILIVLDDVWNEESDKWEPLRNALKCGGARCKILVTTRKVQVARIMGTVDDDILRPKLLSDEDCWLLVRNSALHGRSIAKNEFESLEEIGRSIAKKCNGLPLAAKTLGGLLRFKNTPEEWEKVLKSEMWELEQVEVGLFPHLLLSYHELSPMLKQCFSYCAFFPKDENLKVDDLIRIWMALGYLGNGGDDMEMKGREYFEDLAMRSLFQNFKEDDNTGQITSCKMHDIIHDFAQFLRNAPGPTKSTCPVCDPNLVSRVKEYHSLSWKEETPPNICDCITSLRVLKFGMGLNRSPSGMEKLIHLRWLDMGRTQLFKEDVEIICKLYFLQTLLLSHCSLKEIPREIGNLVHLRHLDFSSNKELRELPESIGSLYELRTLLLSKCSLKEITGEIGNLVHLRHLNLSSNIELMELPESIGSLYELQTLDIKYCNNLNGLPERVAQLIGLRTLSEFSGGSGCNKLGLLKNINRLSESLTLRIRGGSTISDMEELVEDAQQAELRNKINLQSLIVEFLNNEFDKEEKERSSSLWVDVLEALQPNHHSIKYLYIGSYEGLRLPHWISSPLNLVREIELYHFRELSSLPPLGKLPFLKRLRIWGWKELKSVGVEWLGIRGGEVMKDIPSSSSTASNGVVVFPKLNYLSFGLCSKWEEWEDITEEEEESRTISIMPCLTHLEINNCKGLKMLPHRLLRKVESLKVLDIRESTELVNCYGDKDGSPWRSISIIHPQLKLVDRYLEE